MLSGLKKWLQNKTLIRQFSPQTHFYNFEAFKLKLRNYKKNMKKLIYFASGSVVRDTDPRIWIRIQIFMDLDPHPDIHGSGTLLSILISVLTLRLVQILFAVLFPLSC